jgi:uroporphyrinogen-III synthase
MPSGQPSRLLVPPGGPSGVLVTRPEPGAAETARRLSGLGWRPVLAPALVLADRPLAPAAAQALLLTSRAAARALAPGPGLPARLPVLTVGEATATEARQRGFSNVIAAEGDAAALAALAGQRLDPNGGALLLAVGQGYGQDLTALLRRRGFRVRRRIAYAARPASELPPPAIAALRRPGDIGHALFTSPRSAECAISLLQGAGLAGTASELVACAISARVAAVLGALPWREIRVAVRPDQDALLDLLGPAPAWPERGGTE